MVGNSHEHERARKALAWVRAAAADRGLRVNGRRMLLAATPQLLELMRAADRTHTVADLSAAMDVQNDADRTMPLQGAK